jgi:hypothetical protein
MSSDPLSYVPVSLSVTAQYRTHLGDVVHSQKDTYVRIIHFLNERRDESGGDLQPPLSLR